MKFEDNIEEVKKKFYDYDLTDSIIENMSYDDLTNFTITVDYYFTEKQEEHIKILFKNCTAINYEIEKKIYESNDWKLNESHFTITKVIVSDMNEQIEIKLFTIHEDKEFLKIRCQDVTFK